MFEKMSSACACALFRMRLGMLGLGVAALVFSLSALAQQPRPSPVLPTTSAAAGSTGPGTVGTTPTPAAVAPAEPVIRVLLIPQRETTVVSQIVGQINRLGGDIGSSINQGAALVNFDCVELDARLKMSQAEQTTAREQHEAKVRLQGLNAAGDRSL